MIPAHRFAKALPDAGSLLYGAVARPAVISWNADGGQVPRLLAVDREPALRLPGVVDVVVRGAFVGVVARNPAAARYAVAALRMNWDMPPEQERTWHEDGFQLAPTTDEGAPGKVKAQYRWPLRPQAAGARVIADFRRAPSGDTLVVWAPLADFGTLCADLAALLSLPPHAVTLLASTGEASADFAVASAAADAALLAHAVQQPVAVDCQPGDAFGGAWWHTSELASDGCNGVITRWSVRAQAVPKQADPLALVLTNTSGEQRRRVAQVLPTAPVPYAIPGAAVTPLPAGGSAPIREPSGAVREALVFAQESHIDELGRALGEDPVQLRLRHLAGRGAALVQQVASRAGWAGSSRPALHDGGIVTGRGFAYAHVPPSEGQAAAGWSAWVVDVQVDAQTGAVDVTRVVLGHESDDGGAEQASPALLQAQAEAVARKLTSTSSVDSWPAAESALALTSGGASSELVHSAAASSLQPVLQASPSVMLPAAAAVANAIFDATGVRLREPPFAGDRLRSALRSRGLKVDASAGRKSAWAAGAALLVGAAALLPWGGATRPIIKTTVPAVTLYSEATVERGRLIAAAGDCVACHTAPGGVTNAGGLGLPTPFGIIYSTNLTPDVETGIGGWSYAAFERAMRQGVSRDGHRLYPAFPYTAFARMTDDDLQSLYAYLMAQPPVRNQPPATQLPFPFNIRPLLAGWNLAFHDATPFQADATQSATWNRGAYLVNGVGHCGACHTPRNALGAERTGKAFLAGGEAEGWWSPALGAASGAPVPWTEEELFRYLRFGSSTQHGAAAGPMRQVVHGLAQVAESDVRAIAHYLANLPGAGRAPSAAEADATAVRLQARSDALATRLTGPGSRLYEGACATCHEPGPGGLMASAKLSLAVNTNLHDARPDNLVQVLLHGIEPARTTLGGNMPAFADTFDDAQLAELAHYLRARFAPDQVVWRDVEVTAARLRAQAQMPHPR